MKRNRFIRHPALLVLAATSVAVASCDQAVNSPDKSTPPTPAGAATCQASCSVFDDGRPFRLAHQLRDSSGARIHLATFGVHGAGGDRVMLSLDLHGAVLTSEEREIPIFVEAENGIKRITLGELSTPRVAYEFDTEGDALIRYTLPRGLPDYDLDGLSLAQTVGGAKVVSSLGVWGAQTSQIQAAGSPTCTVNTATFTACGVSGTITPYYATLAAQGVGGIWTSDPSTYASKEIQVTFSKPVKNITLTIADPDYSGNNIIANATVIDFAYDGLPNHPTWDTKTNPATGVMAAAFQAAPRDYVAYRDLTFTLVDTSTVKDSILITPTSASRKQGEGVTLTAKSAKGGVLHITSWYWAGPIPGLTHSPNCGTATTCKLNVYESGKIIVYGSIDGVGNSQASATLTVQPCNFDGTDPDYRVNDVGFRKSMIETAATMKGGEKGGIPYYDPLTHNDTLFILPNAQTDSDTCVSYVPDSSQLAPRRGLFRSLADFHAHAYKAGPPLPVGTACHFKANRTAAKGPSKILDSLGNEVGGDYIYEEERGNIGYMIDSDGNLWRWNSPYEADRNHPSQYTIPKGSNGSSTCLVKVH